MRFTCISAFLAALLTSATGVAADATPSAELTAFKQTIRAKYDLKERAFAAP
jgi:hypothetical protein